MHFRDQLIAAPLKPRPLPLGSSIHFRDQLIAAPLKPSASYASAEPRSLISAIS